MPKANIGRIIGKGGQNVSTARPTVGGGQGGAGLQQVVAAESGDKLHRHLLYRRQAQLAHFLLSGATRGVRVSMSAFLACHQCY